MKHFLKAPIMAITIFLFVRLIMNIENNALSLLFVACYAFLLVMLASEMASVVPVGIVFLIVDSMIGTYLATMGSNFGMMFVSTMLVNIVMALILVVYKDSFFKSGKAS